MFRPASHHAPAVWPRAGSAGCAGSSHGAPSAAARLPPRPAVPHHAGPGPRQTEGGDPGGLHRLRDKEQIQSIQLAGPAGLLCQGDSEGVRSPLYLTQLKEDTDCLTRQCCGPMRPFDMNITDMQGQEVLHLNRPLRCQGCCCPCCLQELEVSSPPGTTIGKIEQQWSIIYPKFLVKDQMGEPVLKIEGPFCTCSCFCNDVEFKILSVQTGEQVASSQLQADGGHVNPGRDDHKAMDGIW